MNCKRIEENLSAYLDGALTVEETEEIKTHLMNCPACQKAYDDLKETVTMLSSLEEIIPPAGFRREIYSKLQKEQAQSDRFAFLHLSDRFKRINRYQLMPVAAVLIIMLLSLPLLKDALNMGMAKKADSSPAQTAGEYDMNAKTKENSMRSTADNVAITGFSVKDEALKQQALGIQKNMETAPQAPLAPIDGSVIERKIMKNADIALSVDNYDSTVAAIKDKVAAAGGYITNENGVSAGAEDIRNGYMQVRVPDSQFEVFLSDMDSLGKVKSRNIYSQDVTEEYVDVESRLKAMRTKEERLLAILATSGKLSDILAVENELANTRAQLESLEGRLRYLNNRTEFSNIGINIEQAVTSTQQISTGGLTGVMIKAKEAFILAVNKIIKDAGKLVVLISSALPYIILALIVGYGFWLIIKKKKQV